MNTRKQIRKARKTYNEKIIATAKYEAKQEDRRKRRNR